MAYSYSEVFLATKKRFEEHKKLVYLGPRPNEITCSFNSFRSISSKKKELEGGLSEQQGTMKAVVLNFMKQKNIISMLFDATSA